MTLEQRLVGIGININSNMAVHPYTDIERTLYLAILQIPNNLRMLGLILSWVQMHGTRVHVERLNSICGRKKPEWMGLVAKFAMHNKQHRWKKLVSSPEEWVSNGDLQSNLARVKLRGEEIWSKGSRYIVPMGSEAIGAKYVLDPEQLAKINHHYRNKLIYGPNLRADIITAFSAGAKNPYQAHKICHCSYEPAYRVANDLALAGCSPFAPVAAIAP